MEQITKMLVSDIKSGLRASKELGLDYIYLDAESAKKVVAELSKQEVSYRPYMGEGWGTHIWKCSYCDKEILDPFGSSYCRKCGAKLKWGD